MRFLGEEHYGEDVPDEGEADMEGGEIGWGLGLGDRGLTAATGRRSKMLW